VAISDDGIRVGTAAIEVHGLSKSYRTRAGELLVFRDLSFTIEDRSFVCVVGPSGCGKSTLLLCLAGLLPLSDGRVTIDSQELTGPDPKNIGVIFQDANLLPWRTIAENIGFPLELKGTPKKVWRARAMEYLELVGIADFASAYPHELSGGMRQRVAIARGLVQDPKILLMDEPFAALDEQTRMKMGAEVLRIWEQTRKTIVFVTHNLTEAVFLSDRVIVLGARPAAVLDDMPVDLDRPRTYDAMATEHFGRLRQRIWRQISDLGPE
jgi:NitT/TauT family transport system ATP-binding protein